MSNDSGHKYRIAATRKLRFHRCDLPELSNFKVRNSLAIHRRLEPEHFSFDSEGLSIKAKDWIRLMTEQDLHEAKSKSPIEVVTA